jgi:hypothetical protein
MLTIPRTKAAPGDDAGRSGGRIVQPLFIDAETGTIVKAVVFDVDTGAVFIIGSDASAAGPDVDSGIVNGSEASE